MPHCCTSIDQTRQEARLYFSEAVDSLHARLRELRGTRLSVGRGLIASSRVSVIGDEFQILRFGRRLLRGRFESNAQGCALILISSAPLLRVAAYFWLFIAVISLYASFSDMVFIAETGSFPFEPIAGKFLWCSLVGTFVFPALWGRRWEFRRIAATLSERLQATNNSELQSANRDSCLARWGAWVCCLTAFFVAPLLVVDLR